MSTTDNQRKFETYPWHTPSFHWTRICMIGAYLAFAITHPSEFSTQIMGLFYAAMMLIADIRTVLRWRRKEVVLPLPKSIRSAEGATQYRKLWWSIAGMVGSFPLAVLLVFISVRHPHTIIDYVSLTIFAAGMNLAGWHLIRWCSETLALAAQYQSPHQATRPRRIVTESENSIPIKSAQISPMVLRAGTGKAP